MSYSLDGFCRDVREILKAGAERPEIEKICSKLGQLALEQQFVNEYFNDAQPFGLKRIYVDPEFGFELMAYRYDRARGSPPHDHGNSWAIYAQVREYTDMTEWECVNDGTDPERATLRITRKYRLNPGQAGVFFGRELHSTSTPANTRYLRITGTDLEGVERLRIDAKTGQIQRIRGRQTSPQPA